MGGSTDCSVIRIDSDWSSVGDADGSVWVGVRIAQCGCVCALTDLQRREELRACDEQEVEVEKVAELLVEDLWDECD